MRKRKFHFVKAENILCFGPQGIELHFADHGNLIQIRGINLDLPGTTDDPASNASGKSSLSELIPLGLYGRTVKNPTKSKGAQILNILAKSGSIELQWDDCRIVRTYTRSSSGGVTMKLRMWKSADRIWDNETEVSKGKSTDDTQIEIGQAIGLSHHAFCYVTVFDDSNDHAFLKSKLEHKREIVENLMDLDQYKNYFNNAKSLLKECKDKVSILTREYDRLKDDVEACGRRVVTVCDQESRWKTERKKELVELTHKLQTKQMTLSSTNLGDQIANWHKAQERAETLEGEISVLEGKKDKIKAAITNGRQTLDKAREDKNELYESWSEQGIQIKEVQASLEKAMKLVNDLESLKEGSRCPVCRGVINRNNYEDVIVHSHDTMNKCREVIQKKNSDTQKLRETFESKAASIKNMEAKIMEADAKVATIEGKVRTLQKERLELLNLKKPDGAMAEKVLEVEIVELRKQLKKKEEEANGDGPYKEIIEQAEGEKTKKTKETEDKGKELEEAEAEIPYFEYWVEAFGDNGIRKYVIDGIVPALNERIAHWLNVLVEGKICVTLNNEMDETITRNGNPADYFRACNSEERRINLALSQAFSYVTMLNSGCSPSVVFLDEITGGIDRAGVPGVYKMILELAKERQVFVTTHNEVLMSLLQGCELLTVKKENDISVLL